MEHNLEVTIPSMYLSMRLFIKSYTKDNNKLRLVGQIEWTLNLMNRCPTSENECNISTTKK